MKKGFLVITIAAAAFAVSCNKENNPGAGKNFFDGDKAYMVVNINDVGAASTRGADGGWMAGTADEYAVKDAHFYFYDQSGVFVTEAHVWNGGSAAETGSNVSVEFNGNTLVALSGLTHTAYPDHVVTVLNAPANFTAPNTLDEFAEVLADKKSEGIMNGTNTNFTISTSSYAGVGNGPYYFATPVSANNFVEEPVTYSDPEKKIPNLPDGKEPVKIFVERLAAKVTVAIDDNMSPEKTQLDDGTYGYALSEVLNTLEGEDNNVDAEEDVTFYIKFEGWKLNATARSSNMVKDIDPSLWGTGMDKLGFQWNDANNNRSYWGKSFNYGKGAEGTDYPSTSGGNTDADEAGNGMSTQLSEYLKYTSLNGDVNLNNFGMSEYCAENTNTAGDPQAGTFVITHKNSSAITSVLVKAKVCDINGDSIEFIRADGLIYTPERYLAFALSHLAPVYYKVDEEHYSQITSDYVEIQYTVDGKVIIGLKEDYPDGTFYNAEQQTVPTSYVQGIIDTFNDNLNDANYYKEGNMYYNIPIEHLRDINGNEIAEGNYGVVRNHWYYVNITKVENLGRGIYDPDEVIVPLPETQTYYIGAQISILSWKYVNQDVSL